MFLILKKLLLNIRVFAFDIDYSQYWYFVSDTNLSAFGKYQQI